MRSHTTQPNLAQAQSFTHPFYLLTFNNRWLAGLRIRPLFVSAIKILNEASEADTPQCWAKSGKANFKTVFSGTS